MLPLPLCPVHIQFSAVNAAAVALALVEQAAVKTFESLSNVLL